jgi:hypothetical protein
MELQQATTSSAERWLEGFDILETIKEDVKKIRNSNALDAKEARKILKDEHCAVLGDLDIYNEYGIYVNGRTLRAEKVTTYKAVGQKKLLAYLLGVEEDHPLIAGSNLDLIKKIDLNHDLIEPNLDLKTYYERGIMKKTKYKIIVLNGDYSDGRDLKFDKKEETEKVSD